MGSTTSAQMLLTQRSQTPRPGAPLRSPLVVNILMVRLLCAPTPVRELPPTLLLQPPPQQQPQLLQQLLHHHLPQPQLPPLPPPQLPQSTPTPSRLAAPPPPA